VLEDDVEKEWLYWRRLPHARKRIPLAVVTHERFNFAVCSNDCIFW